MKLKVVIHEAEEGGYWAEVPAIPGCVTHSPTQPSPVSGGGHGRGPEEVPLSGKDRILEIAV